MKTRSGVNYKEIAEKRKEEKRIEKRKKKFRTIKYTPTRLRLMNAQEVRRQEAQDDLREQVLPPLPEDDSFNDTQNSENQDQKQRKMSDYLNKVEKLKMDGNLSENWRRFKRYFNIYMSAGELNTKSDETKINLLLNAVGEEAVEVFDTLALTAEQNRDYNAVLQAFETFCIGKKNIVYERFMFYQRKQKDGEPFDSFLVDIKKLARTCEFADDKEMLRDQIVMGIRDTKTQLRMLEMSDLTYDKAVEKGRQSEISKEQVETMNIAKASEVDEIRRNTQHRYAEHMDDTRSNNKNNMQYNRNSTGYNSKFGNRANARVNETQHREKSMNRDDSKNENGFGRNCKYCNYTHNLGSQYCPAFGKTCNACSRKNHFESVCRVKNVSTLSVEEDYEFDDNAEFFIETLFTETRDTDDAYSYPWIERVEIERSSVEHKIDTGAGVDVLPLRVLKQIAPRALIQQTSVTLRAFAGHQIKPMGTCTLFVSLRGMTLKVKFVIVEFDCTPILGLRTCIRFKLVDPTRNRTVRNSKRNRRL